MNEILKKLLESELLTEDSKKELEESFKTFVDDAVAKAVAEAKETTIAETKLNLHEQYASNKEALIEAVDSKVNDFLINEMSALKKDIKDFRDLEAEYGKKLAEAKKELAKTLKEDFSKVINKMNTFLESRIKVEFNEIRKDIHEAKKYQFGKHIFEAFLPEYRKNFVDATQTEQELLEAKEKLDKLNKKYKNMKRDKEDLYRKVKLKEVLTPLSGRQKDIMESILQGYPTERLEETYKVFIGKVLKESVEESANIINESVDTSKPAKKPLKLDENHTLVTGDVIVENHDNDGKNDANGFKSEIFRLAGL